MNRQVQNVIDRARESRAEPRRAVAPGGEGGHTSEFKVLIIIMIAEFVLFGVEAWNENFEAAVPGSVIAILGFAYKIIRFVLKMKGADLALADAKAEEMVGQLESALRFIDEIRQQAPQTPLPAPSLHATPVDPARIPPGPPFPSPFQADDWPAQSQVDRDRDTPPGV